MNEELLYGVYLVSLDSSLDRETVTLVSSHALSHFAWDEAERLNADSSNGLMYVAYPKSQLALLEEDPFPESLQWFMCLDTAVAN